MIDDLELRLFGGKPSDDREVPRPQMKKWLSDVAASILPEWIAKKNNGEIPAVVTKSFECIGVFSEDAACITESGCSTRYYIELPKNSDGEFIKILDLPNDAGVVSVMQGKREIYNFGSHGGAKVRRRIRFANKFPYTYRVGERLYLFNGVYPAYCKFSIVLATSDLSAFDEDSPFPAPHSMASAIVDAAYEVGVKEIQGIHDIISDGKDVKPIG